METVYDIPLPTSWAALSDRQLRFVFRLLASDCGADELKLRCLLRWGSLRVITKDRETGAWLVAARRPPRREFAVSSLQLAELLSCLEWLGDIPPVPVCLARICRHRPFSPDFDGVPFERYIVCDNLYQGYLQTQDVALLADIATVLYSSPKLKTDRAERLSVFYWFVSVKGYFARRFPDFFASPSMADGSGNLLGNGGGTVGAKQLQEGVDAQIRALTKGDATKEREVLALDTLRALTELNAQAREYRELNHKYHLK